MSDPHSSGVPTWRDPLLLQALHPHLSPEGRRAQRTFLVKCALGGVLDGTAVSLLMPLSSALAQDRPVGPLIALLGAVALGAGLLRYLSARSGYLTAVDYLNHSNERLGRCLAQLPLGWFSHDRTAVLARFVARDSVLVAETAAQLTGQIVTHAVALVTMVVGTLLWNPRIGLGLAALAPIIAIVLVLAQSVLRRSSTISIPSEDELAHRLVEFAACQPMLRAAGRSTRFAPLEEAARDNDRARLKEMWLSILPIMMNGTALQLLVVTAITLVVHGSLGAVTTVVFIGLLLRYARTLEQLGQLTLDLNPVRRPLQHLNAVCSTPSLPEPPSSAPHRGHTLELEHVTFGYDSGRPVVRDISFTVPERTMTAVVGPSGSGKTTIARLVARFWDVDAGTVRLGGTDVRDLRHADLMAQMSMVFQDVYLYDDTVLENIRVARPDANDAEVKAIADLAGVTPIAERIGWDARVGEGGRALSGGERQRVSIARALLKRAPVVLFDEATSALDAENEQNVLAAVQQLRASSTFLVIAHKLDTVRDADQIVVLDEDGHVAEVGTHDELHAAQGAYRRFWDRREAAVGWQLASGDPQGS
ncbi:ABC transporter ATP-binding protein [Arsenicicoccus dermatophilus]|uniref:ABC transporter ATP-binding protein n=1 Tax=Arsenicicoccus dermatophilus TaxID=1076331 RepID=UPI001F4CFBB7|nr:ABC transporter ATP-binding protein [Arsenicicoccus dermatophilus]MCH8614048.1 ABC transporter ATP-binding protein/permease [Arsenicicoccus dermatophilus]